MSAKNSLPAGQRGEPSVESNHKSQMRLLLCGVMRVDNLREFLIVEGQGLFDEHMFVILDSLNAERCMKVVTRCDEHRVDALRGINLFRIRRCKFKTELACCIFGIQSVGGTNSFQRDVLRIDIRQERRLSKIPRPDKTD